jgi:hypothetical protein
VFSFCMQACSILNLEAVMLCFNDRRMQAFFQIRHTFNRTPLSRTAKGNENNLESAGVRYNRVRVSESSIDRLYVRVYLRILCLRVFRQTMTQCLYSRQRGSTLFLTCMKLAPVSFTELCIVDRMLILATDVGCSIL